MKHRAYSAIAQSVEEKMQREECKLQSTENRIHRVHISHRAHSIESGVQTRVQTTENRVYSIDYERWRTEYIEYTVQSLLCRLEYRLQVKENALLYYSIEYKVQRAEDRVSCHLLCSESSVAQNAEEIKWNIEYRSQSVEYSV